MIDYKDFDIFFNFLLKEYPEKSIYEEKLKKYYEKIIIESEKINLVSKKDLEFIARKHFLDSILISDYIREKEITDIGSGAGFPGMIIGILNPEKKIYLIERNLRKSIFLKEVKILLNLENIKVIKEDLLNIKELVGEAFVSRAANYKEILKILKRKTKDKIFYAISSLKENPNEEFYIIENPLIGEKFKVLKIKI